MTKLAYFTISIFLLSGCAVDNFGFVQVRHFENETMQMLRKESWGAYLSTNNSDAGLIFGHMKRILLYPKNSSSSELRLENLLKTVQKDEFIEAKNGVANFNTSPPIALISNGQGLIFNANTFRFGVTLGAESVETIKLSRDFQGIFVFKYSSTGKVRAYYHRQLP